MRWGTAASPRITADPISWRIYYCHEVSQPATRSRSIEGRRGFFVHRCVCHHRDQHAGRTCVQNSAILSQSEPAQIIKYYGK